MNWLQVETRLGAFTVVADGGHITQIHLPGKMGAVESNSNETPVLTAMATQLREYADGQRTQFDVPLKLDGTPFQKAVWGALQDIPFGETRTYGDIAAAIGKPGAARAVGQANAHNPLPVVVPCHRVLAADGLGGYMGQTAPEDGLKARLLEMESLESKR